MQKFWSKAKPFVITGLIAVAAITFWGFIVNRFKAFDGVKNLQANLYGGKLPGEQ